MDTATAMTRATDQVTKLSKQLDDEYTFLYADSSTHTNPYNLLTRLRALELDRHSLVSRTLAVHSRRLALAAACERKLLANAAFARQVCKDDDAHLIQRIDESDAKLRDMLRNISHVNDTYLAAILHHHSVPADDIQHVINANNHLPPQQQTKQDNTTGSRTIVPPQQQQQQQPPTSQAREQVKKTRDLSSATTVASKKKAAGSSSSSSGTGFKPVTKAAFSRLPRNLKIRAGKLDDVNTFYEIVFNTLSSCPGGMTEMQILKETGEEDTKKLEILRGLAVVRCVKEKWILPVNK